MADDARSTSSATADLDTDATTVAQVGVVAEQTARRKRSVRIMAVIAAVCIGAVITVVAIMISRYRPAMGELGPYRRWCVTPCRCVVGCSRVSRTGVARRRRPFFQVLLSTATARGGRDHRHRVEAAVVAVARRVLQRLRRRRLGGELVVGDICMHIDATMHVVMSCCLSVAAVQVASHE
jgi:hypothetical protein